MYIVKSETLFVLIAVNILESGMRQD